jgi:Flp pilus assembly protein protease CpaA
LALIDLAIIAVTLIAAFFDLKIRRIPNWLIGVGVFLGVLFNGLAGFSQLFQSIAGFVVAIVVLLLPFALGWIGAGDVKLFGAIGALLGLRWLPRVFFYSALAAGLIAGGCLISSLSGRVRLKELWLDVKLTLLSMGQVIPEPIHKRTHGGSVPWGVAFSVGTIIAYYFDRTGEWAGF